MGRSERRSPERTNQGHKRDSRDTSHREKRDRHKRKEDSHRERRHRSRSPIDRHRTKEEEDVKPKVKQEQRDRGYDRQENRHSRWSENVQIKQERVMNIKQEREMNDERRRQNRQNQPENPFQGSTNVPPSAQGGNDTGEGAPKEKPNFEQSGALTEDTNTYRGVVIKYNEPPEARKPKRKWRFYIFKGEQQLPTLQIHRQSAYLLGRDRKVADIPVDHPSCSKQHAALQYRLADFTREDGTSGRRVRPYIIDLDSANGTFLNNQKIEPRRYYELQEKDVLKFGFSSRDYVLLHANSKAGEDDD